MSEPSKHEGTNWERLNDLIDAHKRLAERGARTATGDDGEVPHDGYLFCKCDVAREIQELIR